MEFAKHDIGSCIKTAQMPTHICIVFHIVAQQRPNIFNCVDVLMQMFQHDGIMFSMTTKLCTPG